MSTSDVKDCYAVSIWALSGIVMSCDLKKSSTDVIKTHEKLYRSCIIIFPSAEVAGGGGVNYSNTEHLWEVRIRVTTGFLVTHQVERVQRGMSSWWECSERTELITEKSCVRSAAGVVCSAPVQDMRGGGGEGEGEGDYSSEQRDSLEGGVGCGGVLIQSGLVLLITIIGVPAYRRNRGNRRNKMP